MSIFAAAAPVTSISTQLRSALPALVALVTVVAPICALLASPLTVHVRLVVTAAPRLARTVTGDRAPPATSCKT
jgi:hypothetical protein